MSTGKKRFWADEEKREICGQARVSGFSVAQVARRYAMNTNLIHKWLRDPRFAPDCSDTDADVGEDTTFLPVEIEGVVSPSSAPHISSPVHGVVGPLAAQRVDITLSDGRRILVEGSTALSAVLGLIEGLAT